jgi:hypothetical protein
MFLDSSKDPIALVKYEEHSTSPFRLAIGYIGPSRDIIVKISLETSCNLHNTVAIVL